MKIKQKVIYFAGILSIWAFPVLSDISYLEHGNGVLTMSSEIEQYTFYPKDVYDVLIENESEPKCYHVDEENIIHDMTLIAESGAIGSGDDSSEGNYYATYSKNGEYVFLKSFYGDEICQFDVFVVGE